MKNSKGVQWNYMVYSLKEACYSAALPFISGSMIQLFMAHKGISPERIGLFNMFSFLVHLAVMMLLSEIAEKYPNATKQSSRLLFGMALGYAIYLPTAMGMQSSTAVFVVLMLGMVLLRVITACRDIYEYKLLYQIIPIDQYGPLASVSGVAAGLFGAVVAWVCSRLIETGEGDTPYLMGMLLTLALLFVTFLASKKLRVVNDLFHAEKGEKKETIGVGQLFRKPVFYIFLIPNILRGVTYGIIGSIAIIALSMGLNSADAAKTAVAQSVAWLLGGATFYFFGKKIGARRVAVFGGLLLCILMLMPKNNATMFILLFFLASFGRSLVDYAVPTMVFDMVDPQISGVYNAWRNLLTNVTAAISSYVVGLLVGKVHPLVLLAPCALGFLIGSVWYYHFQPKMKLVKPEQSAS